MRRGLVGQTAFGMAVFPIFIVLVFTSEVQAEEWKPTEQIQFVVPYAPKSKIDVLARSIVDIIDEGKLCPVPIIVKNEPGSGSTTGTTFVAQAKGNVHMLVTLISDQVAAPIMAGKGAPTFHDLTPICALIVEEQLIVVKKNSPFKTIEDVVAAGKQRRLTIGGTPTGQEGQICNRLFERAADIKIRYIPFKSASECATALLAGHVDMIWSNPIEFFPRWEAKMVRSIGVARETRLPNLPDIPTFKERGYNATFEMFRGIAAPPGIPLEAVSFYENMMRRMSESSGWKDKFLKQYMLSPYWLGSQEFIQFLTQNEQLLKSILTELGLIK
jgi:putative tricarboxylic transport membrane protein